MGKKKNRKRARIMKRLSAIIYAVIAILIVTLAVIVLMKAPKPETAEERREEYLASITPTPTPTPSPTPVPTPTPTPSPTPEPTPTPLSETAKMSILNRDDIILISAVGDCTLGGVYQSSTAETFESLCYEYGYDYFMENVYDILAMDDLTIANLEVVLVDRGSPRSGRQFIMHGYEDYVYILTEGSIEAVTVANNHAKDFNRDGLKNTKQVCQDENIAVCGFDSIAVYETKGKKIALLGYTVWDYEFDQMEDDIKKMKKECDLVVVSIHGGEEKEYRPTKDQIKYCRGAVDAGADLVLGHHPHVINGIETYKGVKIVYSLANFCFGGNKNPDDKDTFIFQQAFAINGDGTLTPAEINVIPCSISSVTNKNDFRPTPLTGDEYDRVMNKIIKYSDGMEGAFTGLDK